jgi:uncharacterized protein YbaR (Trm112 family)
MAIEIITRGQLPEEKKFIITCKNCKTVFRCIQGDGRWESHRNESYFKIQCPVCKKELYVDSPQEDKPPYRHPKWDA